MSPRQPSPGACAVCLTRGMGDSILHFHGSRPCLAPKPSVRKSCLGSNLGFTSRNDSPSVSRRSLGPQQALMFPGREAGRWGRK